MSKEKDLRTGGGAPAAATGWRSRCDAISTAARSPVPKRGGRHGATDAGLVTAARRCDILCTRANRGRQKKAKGLPGGEEARSRPLKHDAKVRTGRMQDGRQSTLNFEAFVRAAH